MPRFARVALAALLLATAIACDDDLVAPTVVYPPGPAVVRIVPNTSSVTVGELVGVEVRIENGADVASVPFHLRYPSGILQFEPPALQGPFLSMGGAATVFDVSELVAGEIVVALHRTDTGPGASGSGLLATFGFRAMQPGRVPLTFTTASVKDPDGVNLPASFAGASLVVVP